MPAVRLPSAMRDAVKGQDVVAVAGGTVAEALAALCVRHPALEERLFKAPGRLHLHLAVMVDGVQVETLDASLAAESEMVIIPAIGGGSRRRMPCGGCVGPSTSRR